MLEPGVLDDDFTVSYGPLTICVFRGADGAHVVQIDTVEHIGRFRLNLNDDVVYDGDPDKASPLQEHVVDGVTMFSWHGHMHPTRALAIEFGRKAVLDDIDAAALEAEAAALGIEL